MDSLLANYVSSEEEDEVIENDSNSNRPPKPSSLLSSLPKPINQNKPYTDTSTKSNSSSSSLFQSLPKPKSNSNSDSSIPSQPKRVVQFKPPPAFDPHTLNDDDDEDEDEHKQRHQEFQPSSSSSTSVKSFLSSIPAPRNSSTLGVAPTGSGRRSIIETELNHSEPLPEPPVADVSYSNHDSGVYSNNEWSYDPNSSGSHSSYLPNDSGSYDQNESGSYGGGYDPNARGSYDPNEGGSYASYVPSESYASYGQYNGENGSGNMGEGLAFRGRGKRGRNEIPTEIVEVKQDELMKDRPREDQVKLTGIAFGPSYQPVSNSKGKPSKLHKRKHQIGSLFFDMKQKEMELQERRAKGFLTKAETQAKYGW